MHRFLPLPLLAFLILLPTFLHAAPLNSRIESMISSGGAGRAIWGIYAKDLDNGNVLADVNGTRLLVPASNRKLVSVALATEQFSPDHTFRTELICGPISTAGGTNGNLVVKASGDPSWSPEMLGGANGISKLRELARGAAASGLRQVNGDLVIDISPFSEPDFLGHGWTWNNLVNSFSPRPSAFSINSNTAAVSFSPTRAGSPVDWSFPLGGDPFTVLNEATTGRGGSVPTLSVDLLQGGEILHLRGSVPEGSGASGRSIPVGDPVSYTARQLVLALEREGITVRGEIRIDRRVDIQGGGVIASVEGATMRQMVNRCNRDSDNFLAEMLYLLAGARRHGVANYRGSQQLEEAMWDRLGVNRSDYNAIDGSGLSRENFVTPRALVTLLEAKKDIVWFVDSLPTSGRTGTLRHRLSADGMIGRVKAKTGTLNGVSGLSGYVTNNSGRTIAFSIMANNYTTSHAAIRRQIDEIVVELARR